MLRPFFWIVFCSIFFVTKKAKKNLQYNSGVLCFRKFMETTEDFFETIRLKENAKLGKFKRFFFSRVSIERTSDIADISSKMITKPTISFKPSIISKVVTISFVFALDIYFFVAILSYPKPSIQEIIGMFTSFSAVTFFFVRERLFSKSLNYVIAIDNEGILIQGVKYFWFDIYDTAILTDPSGRYPIKHLIIALKDNKTYKKFSLRNFPTLIPDLFAQKLAKQVELYKNSHSTQQKYAMCDDLILSINKVFTEVIH